LVADANQYFELSPDSTWVVYNKTVAGNPDVYVTRADGSETRRLTTDPAEETFSAWVEEGARLLVRRSTGDTTYVTDLVSIEESTATPFITETVYIQGVSPDGQSVVYQIAPTAGVTTTTLFLKPTLGGVAQPVSPTLECGAPACGFNFNGWSDTGRHLAYAFYRSFTPTVGFSQVYITSLEGGTPTYRELNDGEGSSSGAQWLPYGEWFGAYATAEDGSGSKLHLFNARTTAKIPLPNGEDGRLLIQSEWRYDGSE
jgi:Tol biopolymer transport system component